MKNNLLKFSIGDTIKIISKDSILISFIKNNSYLFYKMQAHISYVSKNESWPYNVIGKTNISTNNKENLNRTILNCNEIIHSRIVLTERI